MIVKDDNATVAAVLKTKGRIKCSQPGCTKSFSNKAGYDYHVKRCGVNPEDIQKYYCPHCPDKVYTSKAGLDIHRRTIHETPEPILDQGQDLGRHRQRKAAQKALAQVKLLKDAICDVPGIIKKDSQKIVRYCQNFHPCTSPKRFRDGYQFDGLPALAVTLWLTKDLMHGRCTSK
nr:zinc finger protein 512-like [Lytechinus pictus]